MQLCGRDHAKGLPSSVYGLLKPLSDFVLLLAAPFSARMVRGRVKDRGIFRWAQAGLRSGRLALVSPAKTHLRSVRSHSKCRIKGMIPSQTFLWVGVDHCGLRVSFYGWFVWLNADHSRNCLPPFSPAPEDSASYLLDLEAVTIFPLEIAAFQ